MGGGGGGGPLVEEAARARGARRVVSLSFVGSGGSRDRQRSRGICWCGASFCDRREGRGRGERGKEKERGGSENVREENI